MLNHPCFLKPVGMTESSKEHWALVFLNENRAGECMVDLEAFMNLPAFKLFSLEQRKKLIQKLAKAIQLCDKACLAHGHLTLNTIYLIYSDPNDITSIQFRLANFEHSFFVKGPILTKNLQGLPQYPHQSRPFIDPEIFIQKQ
jgi:hypothetical protein